MQVIGALDATRDLTVAHTSERVQFVPGHGPMSTFGQERRTNPFVADQVLAAGGLEYGNSSGPG